MQSSGRFLMTLTRDMSKKARPPRRPSDKVKEPRPFNKVWDKRPIILKQRATNEAHMEAALAMGLGWRIVGST